MTDAPPIMREISLIAWLLHADDKELADIAHRRAFYDRFYGDPRLLQARIDILTAERVERIAQLSALVGQLSAEYSPILQPTPQAPSLTFSRASAPAVPRPGLGPVGARPQHSAAVRGVAGTVEAGR